MDHLCVPSRRSGAAGRHRARPEVLRAGELRRARASAAPSRRRGVPVLVLEGELEPELSGQAVTRVEAFVEMLSAVEGYVVDIARGCSTSHGPRWRAVPVGARTARKRALRAVRSIAARRPRSARRSSRAEAQGDHDGAHYFQAATPTARCRWPGSLAASRWSCCGRSASTRSTRRTTRRSAGSAARAGALRRRGGAWATRATCAATRAPTWACVVTGRRPRWAGCPGRTCWPAARTSARRSSTGTAPSRTTSGCRWWSSTRPFVYGEAKPHHLAYVRGQLEELVRSRRSASPAAAPTGQGLPTVAAIAKEGPPLGRSAWRPGRAGPAPWTGFDGFFHMAPIVALRGTEECNAYYRMLRDELRDRVPRGIGGIREERHRLLWDNLPIWFAVRELSDPARRRRASTSSAPATPTPGRRPGAAIDPADPIGSVAGPTRTSSSTRTCRTGSASCAGSPGSTASTARSCTATGPASRTRSARWTSSNGWPRRPGSACCCSRPTTPIRAPGPGSRPRTGSRPSWRASQ